MSDPDDTNAPCEVESVWDLNRGDLRLGGGPDSQAISRVDAWPRVGECFRVVLAEEYEWRISEPVDRIEGIR
ncbi:hypothetical protein MYFR107205_26900 [Mycolicibacterium frederiksbergense]